MKSRELTLVVVLGLFVACYLGEDYVQNELVRPLAERQKVVEHLQSELLVHRATNRKIEQAATKIEELKLVGFSGAAEGAQTHYQNWLLGLGQKHALNGFSVTPRETAEQNEQIVAAFSISASSDVDSWRKFLIDFHACPVLHRVSNMQVSVVDHSDKPELIFTLASELLGFTDGGAQNEEFEQLLASQSPKRFPGETAEYVAVNNKGMFMKDIPRLVSKSRDRKNRKKRDTTPVQKVSKPVVVKAKPKPPPPPTRPKPELGKKLMYVGCVLGDKGKEAWLYDQQKKSEIVLKEGEKFTAAGCDGFVKSVGFDFVILRIGDKESKLEISQNLNQLKPLQ